MAHLRTILIAAILAGVAGASFATTAQAENRHGAMPSRMMMNHATRHHSMRHRYTRHRRM